MSERAGVARALARADPSRPPISRYGPWFLYALFFGILVWEEVWELSDHAALR